MTLLPDLERALDLAAHRRRRRANRARLAGGVAALVLVATVGGATIAALRALDASQREERPAAPLRRASSDVGHGIAVTLPPGWALAPESLTPALADPRERFAAATFPLRSRQGCAQMPDGALRSMRPTDAFVSLLERRGGDPGDFAPRPRRFPTQLRRTGLECVSAPGRSAAWIAFRDAGRSFFALVVVGDRAPAAVRAQAFAILDRLRIARR